MTASGSTILEIYDALQAMTVTYTDARGVSKVPTVYSYDAVKNSYNTADLPARLLFPIGQTRGGGMNLTLGPGNMASANYQIIDLFLCEAVGQTQGPFVQSSVQLRYAKAYADAIANKFQWLHQWQTEAFSPTISIVPGRYNYPEGSEFWWFGVLCTISINEIF